MRIETFIKLYEALMEAETDPKIKEIYAKVVHDANNVHGLIVLKEELEKLNKKQET